MYVYLVSCYIIKFQKKLFNMFKCVVFVFVGVKSEQGPYDDVEISESSWGKVPNNDIFLGWWNIVSQPDVLHNVWTFECPVHDRQPRKRNATPKQPSLTQQEWPDHPPRKHNQPDLNNNVHIKHHEEPMGKGNRQWLPVGSPVRSNCQVDQSPSKSKRKPRKVKERPVVGLATHAGKISGGWLAGNTSGDISWHWGVRGSSITWLKGKIRWTCRKPLCLASFTEVVQWFYRGFLPLFPSHSSIPSFAAGSAPFRPWSQHGSAIMEQERLMEARLKWCTDTLVPYLSYPKVRSWIFWRSQNVILNLPFASIIHHWTCPKKCCFLFGWAPSGKSEPSGSHLRKRAGAMNSRTSRSWSRAWTGGRC